jgi:hypothetical protein
MTDLSRKDIHLWKKALNFFIFSSLGGGGGGMWAPFINPDSGPRSYPLLGVLDVHHGSGLVSISEGSNENRGGEKLIFPFIVEISFS